MSKKVIDSCFDEEKTARAILVLDKKIRNVLKRLYENKTYESYYLLISKYLYHLGLDINTIKRTIRRHIALSVYFIVKKEYDKKIKNAKLETIIYHSSTCMLFDKEIDKLLKEPMIDIDLLINKDIAKDNESSPFCVLLNTNDYQTIKKCITDIVSFLDKAGIRTDWIGSVFEVMIDYFIFGCKFADLKYHNHIDLLIPYFNNNSIKLDKFSFEVLDNDYLLNWKPSIESEKGENTDFFSEIDIKEKILGHIIHIIFENDNCNFNKPTMNINNRYYYDMMFNIQQKNILKNTYYFFEPDFLDCTATINTDAIISSFSFKYNEVGYLLSKEEIKKIADREKSRE